MLLISLKLPTYISSKETEINTINLLKNLVAVGPRFSRAFDREFLALLIPEQNVGFLGLNGGCMETVT